MNRPKIVAIPARDEAVTLGPCLEALANQRDDRITAAVICLNNTTDDSLGVINSKAPRLPFPVHIMNVTLPPERACAGVARRMAMERAAGLAGPDGVLLTTDADAEVAADWLVRTMAAIAQGAEAVAGQAEIDPVGARRVPAHLHAADAAECAYAALLDRLACLLDPDPADPWPRHSDHSGASIAVTAAAYARAGGMPDVSLGEDRAFFAALRRVDARIRHAPDVRVIVSARTEGRAPGGMADTIKRRMVMMDPYLDDRLEPAVDAARRARLRALLRPAWEAGAAPQDLRRDLRLAADEFDFVLEPRYFGEAWARAETLSPVLIGRRVRVEDLANETAIAVAMLTNDVRNGAVSAPARPAGTALPAAE
jgi:hypothetical protein